MNSEYRAQIDRIDDEIVKLFAERMDVARKIADYKKENNLPITDTIREKQKVRDLLEKSPEEYRDYVRLLYSEIFELSKSLQRKQNADGTGLTERILSAIENTEKMLPAGATVACQGTGGAFAEQACEKVFRHPNIMFFSSFEAVFTAVEKGLCQYGVVPLENSTAGSVNTVYDLMLRHKFSIVRSTRLKVDHNLLVKPGVKLSEIKEIYSHQQAISQCEGFLSTLGGVKIIPCENTAVAAQMVAKSEDRGIAALASRACIRNYGLECIRESVQDKGNNYTRFICISRDLEIYPGADRTSFMATLPHEPGSLYHLLSRFNALEINLNKLESRPLPDRDFEFMFYFDLDTPVYSAEFIQLMNELDEVCESYYYLGSYSEVV